MSQWGYQVKYRMPFLAGAAIGYVLGTRAGRERYEQIKQRSQKLAANPKVKETTDMLRSRATEVAGTAKDKVGTKLHDTLDGRVPGMNQSEDHPASR